MSSQGKYTSSAPAKSENSNSLNSRLPSSSNFRCLGDLPDPFVSGSGGIAEEMFRRQVVVPAANERTMNEVRNNNSDQQTRGTMNAAMHPRPVGQPMNPGSERRGAHSSTTTPRALLASGTVTNARQIREDDRMVLNTLASGVVMSSGASAGYSVQPPAITPGESAAQYADQASFHKTETTLLVVPLSMFTNRFILRPNDIVICYARNAAMKKIDRHQLSLSSPFFAYWLSGPSVANFTKLIHLRLDKPFAVEAMLNFVVTGRYNITLSPTTHMEFPSLTVFDFHVHVYVTALKYQMPFLIQHAAGKYIDLANETMRNNNERGLIIRTVLRPYSTVAKLCNSLALIWKFTPATPVISRATPAHTDQSEGQHDRPIDALRFAALKLVKTHLSKLTEHRAFIVLVIGNSAFRKQATEFLAKDGIDLQVAIGPTS